jgi:serine phosphatase RsbU (regulator of sigma subunit)
MQMGLMPISPPTVSRAGGGWCLSSGNHVGGDLFQYFTSDDKISIASADVTGHRCICFTMIELNGKSLEAASGGNPYDRHFHDGEVSELKVDDYSQSVREDTQYGAIEAPLHEGDYLVLYAAGILETTHPIRRDVRWG